MIVDVGAMNSHAVIVSRELGIPCAVSVVDATKRIPDGHWSRSTAVPARSRCCDSARRPPLASEAGRPLLP